MKSGAEAGDRFLSSVVAALARIRRQPESFPIWPQLPETQPAIRMATVDRFSYLIAFEQQAKGILVLAVAHAKRRPLYWLERAGNQTD